PKATRKSDIYAFGMIMWEIASRNTEPYKGYISGAIASRIPLGLREPIPKNTPNHFIDAIERCWDTDPDKRPDIESVIKILKKIGAEEKDENKNKNTE